MNQKPLVYPVMDGFIYNTKLRHNLTFMALVLREKFNELRRSGAYRTRWLTIPEDPSQIKIPAFDAYEYQAHVVPGSVYWGWIFVGPPESRDVPGGPAKFSVQVTDGCTDVPLWSEVVSMKNSAGVILPGQGKQNLMSKLLVVGQPGILNVQITSLLSTDASNTQLILCGAEPVSEDLCNGKAA